MPRPKAAGAKAQKAAEEAQQVPAVDAQPADPSEPATAGADGAPLPQKKKRNNNPGVRVQGGRVYDSEKGTTCHQCRQKTVEVKAKCTACTLYFCPKCLENRYQEQVEAANAAADWRCPRCRGDCNCSNCRKKQGKEATGQLANIAKKAGFGSVKDLLHKNPNAKALQLPRAPSSSDAAGAAAAEEGGGAARKPRAPARRKAAAAAAAAAEEELLEDEALPPRKQPMPEAQALAVHKAAAGGSGAAVGSRRQRGAGAWAADVPAVTEAPGGQAGAELAVVLEFLQVFGARLQLRSPSLAAFAAELLQPAQPAQQQQLLCPSEEESLVVLVHRRLLDLVRTYWNVKGEVSASGWQGIMRAYYAASLLSQRQALALRWQHGPPAVAGEIFSRPAVTAADEEAEGEADGGPEGMMDVEMEATQGEGGQQEGEQQPVAALGAAPVAAVEYPGGSYWGLPAEARVGMLHALVNDALECGELRQFIESSMGDALDEEKERRQQLAGVRKEARVAIARERDQQIALMIASADGSALTLEQQQQMLEQARQRAEAATNTAAAAKMKALTEKVHPPTVRAAVVGSDREGRRYIQLQVAPLLTGDGGVVVQSGGSEGLCSSSADAEGGANGSGSGAGEALCCYPGASLADVAAALHPQGKREGPLREALVHAFKLPALRTAPEPAAGAEPQAQQREESGSQVADAPANQVPAGTRRGKKPAAGGRRSKSSSPAALVEEEEALADNLPAAAGGKPASKRSRQSSEAGSSAERAAPKRRRGAAPAAAAVPAAVPQPAAKPARQRSTRVTSKRAAAGSGVEEAVLPLRVDDMLSA